MELTWKQWHTRLLWWGLKLFIGGTIVWVLLSLPEPLTTQAAIVQRQMQLIAVMIVAFVAAFSEINKLIAWHIDQTET